MRSTISSTTWPVEGRRAFGTNGMLLQVGIGQYKVGFDGDLLVARALGSCVGIVLYDERQRVGGLAHVLLPAPMNGAAVPAGKFAVSAVPALLAKMEQICRRRPRVRARLVGGATMFGRRGGAQGVGERNVAAARTALGEFDVPLAAEDVGGTWARSATLDVANGRLRVSSYQKGIVEL